MMHDYLILTSDYDRCTDQSVGEYFRFDNVTDFATDEGVQECLQEIYMNVNCSVDVFVQDKDFRWVGVELKRPVFTLGK